MVENSQKSVQSVYRDRAVLLALLNNQDSICLATSLAWGEVIPILRKYMTLLESVEDDTYEDAPRILRVKAEAVPVVLELVSGFDTFLKLQRLYKGDPEEVLLYRWESLRSKAIGMLQILGEGFIYVSTRASKLHVRNRAVRFVTELSDLLVTVKDRDEHKGLLVPLQNLIVALTSAVRAREKELFSER